MTTLRQIINDREENMNPPEWSIEDEAILRAYNYAVDKLDICKELLSEGGSLEVMLKQAYQQGFLNGFGHKFDNTNYEEK